MSKSRSEVRRGAYYDSVVLMQLQRALADLPGVEDAGVVMATAANCDILKASGLPVVDSASAEDLLIVVKAVDEKTAEDALAKVDNLLSKRRSSTVQSYRPKSMAKAIQQLPEANWVLISVPGRYAGAVAREALELGRNVFLFSDNVPIEEEIQLKQFALGRGLLLMGPDCGTAIIGGAGFGFANRVRSGSIGLVGASGTGLQAITSAIHQAGAGISQAIGTGGRDLKQQVKAISTHQGLDYLANDPNTEVIVVVSKPPEPTVAAKLLNHAASISKPVVIDLIGKAPPTKSMGNLHFAVSLQDAADTAVTLSSFSTQNAAGYNSSSDAGQESLGYIRGLFSGGTLAYEAVVVLSNLVPDLYSNVPLYDRQRLSDITKSKGHTILDLGEDEFTQGRLHPMMDNDLRLRRLFQEASDPEVKAIVLDLVLGEGAHSDPASEIAPAIKEAKDQAAEEGRNLVFAVIIIGTDEDIQGMGEQIIQLKEAGALVFSNTPEAMYQLSTLVTEPGTYQGKPLDKSAFIPPVAAINVGLEIFFNSLQDQSVEVIQVDWRPPAGGNEKLMSLLAQMR